ncbi:hypothetical protein [Actimicrobium antarcticum]|uniref:Transmembrane protein n=1 Tax=Actimicrobium antarcticum TaxID=1051899 RepID=A0ABP7SIV8_9BURK
MLNRSLAASLIGLALLSGMPVRAADNSFSMAVIAPSDDSALRQAIIDTDDDNLAFVVVNGIKATSEACTDATYLERKILFDNAKNGLVVSLAGSDWTGCKSTAGKSIAIERLNRLRELFFSEDFSFGATKIPLTRQSSAPKFRSYAENSRWEFGPVMFATLNLPSDNNHFLSAAGRNNEFEDRLIANREWLQRLVTVATMRKMEAIVLFSDSDPLALPAAPVPRRDGYTEMRTQLTHLAGRFHGKILVIHDDVRPGAGPLGAIRWSKNLGTLAIGSRWVRLHVTPGADMIFGISTSGGVTSSRSGNEKAATMK